MIGRQRILHSVFLLTLTAAAAFGQKQPPAYVLSAGDKAVIVLGDTPAGLSGFSVLREAPGDREFVSLTEKPVQPQEDPAIAREMMGSDFDWISRRVQTVDPDAVWRRIRARHDLSVVLSLVSNGLRMALGRTFFDLDVSAGQTYTYRVLLLDSLGKEMGRVEKQLAIAPARIPAPPTNVRAETGRKEVTVRWDYPRFAGGDADLTVGFSVTRIGGGGAPVLLTSSPVLRAEGQLQFTDRDAAEGTPLTYAVQSVDIIGTMSSPASAPPVTLVDKTPPMAPQGVTAVDQKSGVLLVWKISAEANVDHYIVYKSAKEDSGYLSINPAPIPLAQPRFLDETPVRGVVAYYKVAAVSTSGVLSALSAAAPIIPQKTKPPAAVTGLQFTVDARKRSVAFTWNPVDEPDVKGYIVFRGQSRTSMVRLTSKPLPASPSPAWEDAGYQGAGLPAGTTLVYAFAALDTSLNAGEPVFVEVPIPDTLPPSAAFALSARPTREGKVSLAWQPSQSRNLSQHRLQRKSDGDYAQVAELPAAVTRWEDATVAKGTTYTYRLLEVSSAGLESAPSPEATVTATTSVPPGPPQELAAILTPKGVTLSWKASASSDIAGYVISRAPYTGAQFTRLTAAPLKDTSWLDARGQKENVYAVAAVDTSGNESARVIAVVKMPAGSQ
jgi:fibronectin type 3 domain-containing protein